MKKFFVTAAILLMACTQVHAQTQGKYVNSSSAKLVRLVDAANNDGYNLQNDGFSLGGGWLRQGTGNWVPMFTMNLVAGKEYRFIAVGDMDARDVDLQILDSGGNVVASDTTVSPEAIVNFRPTNNGKYTVRLRLYASRDNEPSMCMAIVLIRK